MTRCPVVQKEAMVAVHPLLVQALALALGPLASEYLILSPPLVDTASLMETHRLREQAMARCRHLEALAAKVVPALGLMLTQQAQVGLLLLMFWLSE